MFLGRLFVHSWTVDDELGSFPHLLNSTRRFASMFREPLTVLLDANPHSDPAHRAGPLLLMGGPALLSALHLSLWWQSHELGRVPGGREPPVLDCQLSVRDPSVGGIRARTSGPGQLCRGSRLQPCFGNRSLTHELSSGVRFMNGIVSITTLLSLFFSQWAEGRSSLVEGVIAAIAGSHPPGRRPVPPPLPPLDAELVVSLECVSAHPLVEGGVWVPSVAFQALRRHLAFTLRPGEVYRLRVYLLRPGSLLSNNWRPFPGVEPIGELDLLDGLRLHPQLVGPPFRSVRTTECSLVAQTKPDSPNPGPEELLRMQSLRKVLRRRRILP